MKKIAVVAHGDKTLGGGLTELRAVLAREGYPDPLWYEVAKSSEAPKYARRAFDKGADVIFAWGGDGTVQRCIDALAGTDALIAILPAGTANLERNFERQRQHGVNVEWLKPVDLKQRFPSIRARVFL